MDAYLKLTDVVLLGRTFDEYLRFFALTADEIKGKLVLDVGSGVSSFCANARKIGIIATGADPIYGLSPNEIKAKCESDLVSVAEQLPAIADNYNWDFYNGVDQLCEFRRRAYEDFFEDFEIHPEHYLCAKLPKIDLANDSFDITLSSHFLFLYDEQFDYEMHRDSILELARITSYEARIYPIANLRAQRSQFVNRVLRDPLLKNLSFEIRAPGFEFLKNSNEMLVIRK